MLSKEIREGLRAEREHLVQKRRDLDTKIEAIDALLSPGEDSRPTQPRLALGDVSGPLVGKGLREAMRTVLLAYPTGLKPADLSAKLEQLGYQSRGALGVRERVWAEIGRLKKERRIQKRGRRVVWTAKDQAAALRGADVPENGQPSHEKAG
jgi:hypothetical protein